jgi:Kef-type K+ transport system membrane component KefB
MSAPAATIPPLGAHQLLVLLLQTGLLLGTALLMGRLALRLRTPPVVGELFAGVLLGPSLLAHAAPGPSRWLLPADPSQMHLLDAVGQLGVLLLVGIAGMHVDLGLVRRKGATAAAVSAGGLLVPFGLGVGVGLLLPASLLAPDGDRTVFALFVGVALCVSAIPVIAKTLLELRLLHRNLGQLIMSAAVVDDIVGWFTLSVVSAMATSQLHEGRVALSLAFVAGVVVFTVVVGRPLVRWVLRAASRSEESAITVGAAVMLLLLGAAGTQALGMEAVLGAFLVGILIASAGRVYVERLVPLRVFVMVVLAPIFFATAGLRVDLTALRQLEVLAAAAVVLSVAILGKFAGAYLGARVGRLDHAEALGLGAGLNSRGVIEVVIAMVGLRLGVLSGEMYTIVVLVAIVTSMMAPPTLRWAVRRIPLTAEERELESSFVGY